jgi:hypothetical protein
VGATRQRCFARPVDYGNRRRPCHRLRTLTEKCGSAKEQTGAARAQYWLEDRRLENRRRLYVSIFRHFPGNEKT